MQKAPENQERLAFGSFDSLFGNNFYFLATERNAKFEDRLYTLGGHFGTILVVVNLLQCRLSKILQIIRRILIGLQAEDRTLQRNLQSRRLPIARTESAITAFMYVA